MRDYIILEPSGYIMEAEGWTINVYDTDGNRVNSRDPGDEGWEDWADLLEMPEYKPCPSCGDGMEDGESICADCEPVDA